MYRGYVHRGPPPKCKSCNGTGRQGQPSPPAGWNCPDCNGTGIEGNGLGIIIGLAFGAIVWGAFVWFLAKQFN